MRNALDRAAVVAWALALLAMVLLAGAIALLLIQPVATAGLEGILAPALEVLALALTGALIVTGRRRHPIGWIYVASALLIALGIFAVAYSALAQQLPLPLGPLADAVFTISWFAGSLLPITIGLLLFPDGRLPSRRWWAVVAISAVGYLAIVGNNALAGRPEYETLHSLAALGLFAIPAAILTSVGSLIWRWQHAVGVERQQLKWVAAATLFLALDFIAVIFLASVGAIPQSGGAVALLALGVALVPISVGIAILRYRLYDIDILINRTLVYGTITALLGGSFVAAQELLKRTFIATTGASSDLAVVLALFVIVTLFTPLRARVQAIVDRRLKTAGSAQAPASAAAIADALRTFATLRHEGILTDDEFAAKKKQVLGI